MSLVTKRALADTDESAVTTKKRKLNTTPEPVDAQSFLADDDDKDEKPEDEHDDHAEHSVDDCEDDGLPLPSDAWESLDLHENTLLSLYEQGFDKMMKIQELSIPMLLEGENLVGAARTGSGKTLAFLVPTIELLVDNAWNYNEDGVGALVIAPTRELAMQIHSVAVKLCTFHRDLSVGLLIGGNPRERDVKFITKGMSMCIATPGRLLDHLQRTKEFMCSNVKILVLDEADRILDEGYEKEVKAILRFLPTQQRQTMLFSATQTKKTADLIRLSFSSKPKFVDDGSCIDYAALLKKKKKTNKDQKDGVTPTLPCLVQGYITVPLQRKFLLLFSFLKKHGGDKKIMVFFSTVNVTKYYVQLLNYIDVKVYGLYGAMSQSERTKTFDAFIGAKRGVLLATNVAARGLDIPEIDWIIQFDPPNDIKNYVHRVGRTNRGKHENQGRALLFLIPQESKYLQVLNRYNIRLKQYECPAPTKIANIQSQLEKITNSVYFLHVSAHNAYQAYVREYGLRNSHVFDVMNINIIHLAKSFGLVAPPKTSVQVKRKKKYKTVIMRLATNEHAQNEERGWYDPDDGAQ